MPVSGVLLALVLLWVALGSVASAQPVAGGTLAVTVGPPPSGTFNVDLWVVAPGRSTKRVIRTKRIAIRDPSWAPSGRRIVFGVAQDPVEERGLDLYVADANGSHRRRLTGSAAAEYTPAWSPDGGTIAFGRSRVGQIASLWLMRPDGQGQRRLTSGWSPAWSPDGKRLVFTSDGVLWLIGRGGHGRHRLTPPPTDPACDFSGGEVSDYEGAPAWSPDGRWIAFVRYCGVAGSGTEVDSLYLIHPDGSGLRRITLGPADDSPTWSPDSRRIAFVRVGHVAVISRNGGRVRSLFAPRGREVFQVAWRRGD